MSTREREDCYSWWASLKHGGLLITPSRLEEFFPEKIEPLSNHFSDRLRRSVIRVLAADEQHLTELMDTVLEEILGLDKNCWLKGNNVDPKWSHKIITQETVKPRRIWQGLNDSILPVFIADSSLSSSKEQTGSVTRLGIGRGRRAVSRVIEWLRRANQKIALLTNGRQWRLIHAGADYDAWCEWDINLWFQEGVAGQQVTALRILLGKDSLEAKSSDKPSSLIAAIQASRRGQAELSSMLGERVRQAVENLIRVSSPVLEKLIQEENSPVEPRDIYVAATRIIMRCVVILFAEARDLLPRTNDIYNDSYGIQGLREQLEKLSGGRPEERLRNYHSAWPRLVALFRLVYFGSPQELLPVSRYGGGLFVSGDKDSSDPILKALAFMESPQNAPSDADIYKILELLCRSKVKVRQGNKSSLVDSPVDFSDLSSEYIGILYEGLLDYELRRAPINEPMIFLNIGNQPVLPFSRLEQMSDKDVAQLLEKLKQDKKESSSEDEGNGEDAEAELTEENDENEGNDEDAVEEIVAEDQEIHLTDNNDSSFYKNKIQTWAENAVKVAKLVKPLKKNPTLFEQEAFEQEVAKTVKTLLGRIIMPEEWFLVRWGGTRKGSGTFYTRPQLAVPTTRRTLQPLAYENLLETGSDINKLTDIEWRVRKPEEILSLKVCDPAMGSGSFLIAALRYLTEALIESLHLYERLDSNSERTICRLADGLALDHPSQETLPLPKNDPEFEDRLRAKLKRHIVEKCLYGVDIDPLAVELARMALWVETMDPRLPFGFLDHKLKCGNSLVGCWFDQFQDYPIMAWTRKAGDENHTNGVNFGKEVWTRQLKNLVNNKIKNELRGWITGQSEDVFEFAKQGYTAEGIHDEALAVFDELHNLTITDTEGRETVYKEKILNNDSFIKLKESFDQWCAIWFWPIPHLDIALTPMNFYDPSSATKTLLKQVVDKHRFFHWELEFPDVFAKTNSGFDAIIGNPPWEIQKPNSKEFFSNIDPLYRTYGKQEALERQKQMFNSLSTEEDWLVYSTSLKSLSNWNKNAGYPFGDRIIIDKYGKQSHSFSLGGGGKDSFAKSENYHDRWRNKRVTRNKSYADPQHPFRYQGSADINTYKMFSEMAYVILKEGGYFGFIVPSGIYTDNGSTELRNLFLSKCRWNWLFGFENREGIFDIHRSFKFCPIIIRKGGVTDNIKTTFMQRSVSTWEEAEKYVISYPSKQVEQFSPNSKAILEIRNQRDLEVLEKIYANGVLLGDKSPDGWGIEYAREFDMTNDSKLFPPRTKWEEEGYQPDEYGHWLKGNWQPYNGDKSILKRPKDCLLSWNGSYRIFVDDIKDIALPFYEGRMIGQFDFSQKGWVSGKGRTAIWRDIAWENKIIEAQYLMAYKDVINSPKSYFFPKMAYMRISSATNSRTTIPTYLTKVPAGDSVFFFRSLSHSITDSLLIIGIWGSFVYDYQTRNRLGGLNMSEFLMLETSLPLKTSLVEYKGFLLAVVAGLSLPHLFFAVDWIELKPMFKKCTNLLSWKKLWSITHHERLRLRCILDAIIAQLYGLEMDDFLWILRDCEFSCQTISLKSFSKSLDPKGFWRIDKEKDPELRHTVLSLIAFHELKRIGLKAFLELNDGEGWMLPEKLRLADYGLGHDDRAKEYQPVSSRLGERFLPWQLEQTPEESWEECERHAELISKIVPIPTGQSKEQQKHKQEIGQTLELPFEQPTDLFGNPLETNLFGEVIYPKSGRKKR